MLFRPKQAEITKINQQIMLEKSGQFRPIQAKLGVYGTKKIPMGVKGQCLGLSLVSLVTINTTSLDINSGQHQNHQRTNHQHNKRQSPIVSIYHQHQYSYPQPDSPPSSPHHCPSLPTTARPHHSLTTSCDSPFAIFAVDQ